MLVARKQANAGTRVTTGQLNLSARAYCRILKLALTFGGSIAVLCQVNDELVLLTQHYPNRAHGLIAFIDQPMGGSGFENKAVTSF